MQHPLKNVIILFFPKIKREDDKCKEKEIKDLSFISFMYKIFFLEKERKHKMKRNFLIVKMK